MKLIYLVMLFSCFACSDGSDKGDAIDETVFFEPESADGELIDGPANVRDKPNGELIFMLEDGVSVQAGNVMNNWLKVGLFIDVNKIQRVSGIIRKGDDLLLKNEERIGEMLKDQPLLMINENTGSAYVEGFTHINNIQKESLIENDLVLFIDERGRNLKEFDRFILKHDLHPDNRFMNYEGYYVYENMTVDPSPGFRILLLFKENNLKGIYHSRAMNIKNTNTYDLEGFSDSVTFFNDYPTKDQLEFVEYMKVWLQGVD